MNKQREKIRRYIVVLTLFLVFFTIVTTIQVHAAPSPINPDEEQTVRDKAAEYNLDAYQSYMVSEQRFFQSLDTNKWINALANFFFEINKIIYTVFKEGIELLGDSSIVKDYVTTFTNYSTSIYDTFYKSFGSTIIACMAIYIFYLYFGKSTQQAISQLLIFSAVMIFSFSWNSHAPTFIRWFDSISNEVQAELIRNTSRVQGSSNATPTSHAQNVLFELAIEEPYLLLNYGITDKNKIVTLENPTIITDLLYTGELTEERFSEIENSLEEQAETNLFLTAEKAGWKSGIAFLSIFGTIVLGVPILVVQFFNFLTGILALLLSSVMGFAMFLSLIPRFRSACWQMFQSLVGLFGIRIILGISYMLLISVVNVVRGIIPINGVGTYALQIIAIALTMYVLWKYRNKIIGLVSAGMIASVDGGMTDAVGGFLNNGKKKKEEDREDREGLEPVETKKQETEYDSPYRRQRHQGENTNEDFYDHMKSADNAAEEETEQENLQGEFVDVDEIDDGESQDLDTESDDFIEDETANLENENELAPLDSIDESDIDFSEDDLLLEDMEVDTDIDSLDAEDDSQENYVVDATMEGIGEDMSGEQSMLDDTDISDLSLNDDELDKLENMELVVDSENDYQEEIVGDSMPFVGGVAGETSTVDGSEIEQKEDGFETTELLENQALVSEIDRESFNELLNEARGD